MINPKWLAYNDVENEGGEGYNPYPKYIADTDEATTFNGTSTRVRIAISGNTYPNRDLMRKLGCTWDSSSRSWVGMLIPGKFVLPKGCIATILNK